MTKDEIVRKLKDSDLQVTFTKVDGATRVMKCTSNIPESAGNSKISDPRAPKGDNVVTVYDIESNGWRSFHADKVQEVVELDTRFGLLQG